MHLLRTGFPMFLYLGSNLILRTVDRIVVLRFEGAEQLGLYALGVIALTLVMNLSDSVCYVLYPQLLRRYAESGERAEAIRDRVRRTLTLLAVFVPAVCTLIFLAGREAVMLVLPSFVPGAGVLRVLCFSALGLAIANLSSIVLMTTHRQWHLMLTAIGSAALGAILDTWALRSGYGIKGVAWAMFATYVSTGALMLWFCGRALKLGRREGIALVARSFAPFVIAMALASGIDRLVPGHNHPSDLLRWGRVTLNMALFAGLYALAMGPFVRGLGLRRALAEARVPGFGPQPSSDAPETVTP
jgi:O-antigen/teichoic acid export membrane protein